MRRARDDGRSHARDRDRRLPHRRRALPDRPRRRGAARGSDDPRGRRFGRDRLDHVRQLLVFEPRGHADMYGCHVVPPNGAGADLGVVFFHNEGYSTACGHGTTALVTWVLESGRLPITGPEAAARRLHLPEDHRSAPGRGVG